MRFETQLDLSDLSGFVEERVLVSRSYQQLVVARERHGFLEEARLEFEAHLEEVCLCLLLLYLRPRLCDLRRFLAAGLLARRLLRASASFSVGLLSLFYFNLKTPSSVVLPNKICWVILTA